jgi:diguanylate cyclase (GGDEF)-like protein
MLRTSDTVARLGGDEFTILLPEITQVKDAPKVARKILNEFKNPHIVDGREIFITPSIGVAVYPDTGQDTHSLMRNADLAMYRAKELGRNTFQCYTPAINQLPLPFTYA